MPFLEIKSADFGYNVPLISNVNASLDLGDVCLLVGNNGVGKTTLMKSILGQVPLLKGKISIDGSAAETLSALDIAQQVSVVFSKLYFKGFDFFGQICLLSLLHEPYR